jgi:uncharacterized protein YbcI
MDKSQSTLAQQVAEAAVALERQRTGHEPESARVVLGEDTVVITLYGALSPAERAMAANPAGAAKVQEFHRQLFATGCGPLCQAIERIVGVEVREASSEVPTVSDAALSAFTTGTVVQVFLLARRVPSDLCSASERVGHGSGRPSLIDPARDGRDGYNRKTQLF